MSHRRTSRYFNWRRAWLGGALLGLVASGCTANDGASPTASAKTPTVAFESVDGPPESVFRRLVQNLSNEAAVRQVAVVSRDSSAQYRIRSYLAAVVQGKRSTVAWVWDVYDPDQRRALRISGEEPASLGGTGTWAAVDEAVLNRIAKTGMERLTAFLAAGPGQTPAAPSRAPASPDAAPTLALALTER